MITRRGFLQSITAFVAAVPLFNIDKMVGISQKWYMTISDEIILTNCQDITSDQDRRCGVDINLKFVVTSEDLYRRYPTIWKKVFDNQGNISFYKVEINDCKLYRYGKLFRKWQSQFPLLMCKDRELVIYWKIVDEDVPYDNNSIEHYY